MRMQTFEDTFKKDEFAVGDNFWLGDWEFEVVNTRSPGRVIAGDEVVFRWELTRPEFIQVMTDNHPEIEDPEGFFAEHEDEIIHRFQKGFDALIGECGATYGTVMNDAIDEAVKEREDAPADRLAAEKGQGPTLSRDDDEKGSEPSPSYSNKCKEVNTQYGYRKTTKDGGLPRTVRCDIREDQQRCRSDRDLAGGFQGSQVTADPGRACRERRRTRHSQAKGLPEEAGHRVP